jgi:hypothetical protein
MSLPAATRPNATRWNVTIVAVVIPAESAGNPLTDAGVLAT